MRSVSSTGLTADAQKRFRTIAASLSSPSTKKALSSRFERSPRRPGGIIAPPAAVIAFVVARVGGAK